MKVAVLASGRGSNFQAIIEASENNELPNVSIELLIVNKKKAYAIERAKKHKIPFYLVESDNKERKLFESEMIEILEKNDVDFIVLAGFMRILSPLFVNKYNNKIINIHPSLLPLFPGSHAHKDAIEAGVNESGCTVHFVDEGVDTGPIILQESISIDKEDNEETLAEKILPLEHKLLPKALNLLSSKN
mgnify:FL=1|jgi:phosphoribosylglycinamide formyltransferase-1|tara:strand:- start:72 stop:638 length:567 start_codon:yes stop_codon:yes gene_type:complete